MKNYALNYNDYKMFILSYEVDGDKIIINYADGEKSFIPYTLENEKKILKKLKKQVLIGEINKEKFTKKINISSILSLLYLILLVCNLLILTEGQSSAPILSKILIIYCSLMSIISICSVIINKIKIRDIDKNIKFLSNQDKINKFIKEKSASLENINNKTKEELEPIIENKKEMNINDVDKISYGNLQELISYIERIEEYDLSNNKEEPSKVLTKRNNS